MNGRAVLFADPFPATGGGGAGGGGGFNGGTGVSAPPATPAAQAAQNSPAAAAATPQGPNKGGGNSGGVNGGIIGQRKLVLLAGIPHTEILKARSVNVVYSSVDDVDLKVRFDNSQALDIRVGAFFSPGFEFFETRITSSVDTELVVQFGAAFSA